MKGLLCSLLLLSTQSKLFSEQECFNGLANCSTRGQPCCDGWAVSADFLAWFPSEEVASIWVDEITVGLNTSSWKAPGFNFKWDYGFRLGIGYDLVHDQWDTTLNWTWFRTDASHHIPPQPHTDISPEFFAAFLSRDVPQSMRGKWSLLFNTLDWDLGRSYCISNCLSLRPFLGLKCGWIDQSIRVNYYNLTINKALTSNVGHEHLKNNFWGIGPLGGLNSLWKIGDFGCRFIDLFGDFSMAAMWGRWDCSDVYKNLTAVKFSVNTDTSTLGALMFRGFMGIGWQADFNASGSRFVAKLGYEMQFWLNQLRIATFQLQRLHNDLTLQGVTFNCRIDF